MEIKEGQLFECGPHLLGCGDLLEDHWERFYGDKQIDLVYSDPPWGAGLAKMFRTMNGQKGKNAEYEKLMNRWADVASSAKRGAFGEMGKGWERDLCRPMQERGWYMMVEFEVTYSGGKPCLVQFFKPQWEQDNIPPLYDLTGATLVKTAMSITSPGQSVADPTIGLGHTLRAGHGMGLRVYGMELNPKRLQRCIDWCKKRGMPPKLVMDLNL